MQWSQIKGRKLVSTSTADTVGKVDGFLFDPAGQAVVALVVKKTATGSVVRWSDLVAVGADAVTVPSADVVVEPEGDLSALAEKRGDVLKKRVLTTEGVAVGKVKDVDLDPETGAVRELLLEDRSIAGTRLRGVGSYAVVVSADSHGS